MKSEFLKIAGVKTEKQFYAKFPDEKSFFKAHPEAKKLIKKAQVGIQVDSNGNGIPDYLEGIQPIQGPQNRINLPNAPIAQEEIYNPATQSGLPTYIPSIQNTISQGQAITEAAPLPETAPLNKASFVDKAMPFVGAAQNIISGIGALGAQKQEKRRVRQMRKLTDVQKIASGTREEDPERRYVRPEDVIIQPDQMFPSYGVGTNVLTAKYGAEIQNTYAPGTIYDDGGYEPLNDSDVVKQYYYGGDVPRAQSGFSTMLNNSGFGKFMGSEGGGQALGMLTGALGNNSGESQIGQGIGTAAGTIFGGPVGGMIGGALGNVVGGLFNTSQRSIKRDRRAIKRNVDTMMGNQLGQSIQNQYTGYMEEGGQITNPQLITRFGELDEQDFYDYAHEGMPSFRAGGHLRSYTPVSERGLKTYAMGGELETHWGGGAETMSYNPYLPGEGETIMFRGQSHDESDGYGNTGIGITYGNSPVEVERGEPAIKLKDGSSGEENLTVYGNLQIPNEYVDLLGDPKAKGKKFKNYIAEISKEENKQNKLVEKSTNMLNSLDVRNSFDKLKLESLSANIQGANMKLKEIAQKKINAADLQNAINDTAEEYGLVADDLAKGKAKMDKQALKEYAEYGKSISKAEAGTTTDDGRKITRVERERLIKSGEYKVDPSNPKRIYRVKSKSATSEEKKSASAMDNIPAQKLDKTTGFAGGVTKEKFEEFKKRFPDYPGIDKLDPKDPMSLHDFKTWYNNKAKAMGSTARILDDPKTEKNPQGLPIFGDQYLSATLDDAKKETPASSESDYLEVEDEDKRYETTPYKRSTVMDIANQILPFIRPTDQEPLDPNQLYGEMFALSNNQLEPVQAQSYTPDLGTPYDISLQDQLNANQADFNSLQRMVGYNPAAASQLAAQKYAANTGVLGEQFRANQAMRAGVYDKNRDILNDAKLKNLAIFDQQYVRQAQARSNTKAIAQAALSSIGDKYAKNRLENRQLGIMENMYNYRFDSQGRAINMNPLYQANIPTMYGEQKNPNMIPVKDASGNIVEYRFVGPSSDTSTDASTSAESTAPTTYYLNPEYTPFEEVQEDVYDEVAPKRKGGVVRKNYSQSSIVRQFK
jgi:hypothetical protein